MPNERLEKLAVQADDKLVAVGFAYTDNSSRRLVVRLHRERGPRHDVQQDGYTTFLPSGITDAIGWAVALQSDGKIVVTGYCTGTDGANDMLVARYKSNGTLDTSFGGGNGYVRLDGPAVPQSTEYGADVVIQPDGKIVVCGCTWVTGSRATYSLRASM